KQHGKIRLATHNQNEHFFPEITLGDYNIDMLVSALMMFLGAQCDILCDDLRNLGSVSSDFNKEIKRCVRHHKEILRFAESCNKFFNFMMLGQFFTSAVCLAMALFRLALVTPSSFQFYTLLCSIASMIVQIFTYCWFGNEVETKSNQIAYAAFKSDWTKQSSEVKKILIIFTIRTQKPIKLSTFNLFYLSLSTFMTVLFLTISGELGYTRFSFVSFGSALSALNIDMLTSALMMYIGAQCDILCDNLKNLGYSTTDDYEKELIDVIKHHKKILM
ncbi:7tm 6 domain containing protein, partial [Asbolus verrucosus]